MTTHTVRPGSDLVELHTSVEEDAQRLLATTTDEQSALGRLLATRKPLVPEGLFGSGRKRPISKPARPPSGLSPIGVRSIR